MSVPFSQSPGPPTETFKVDLRGQVLLHHVLPAGRPGRGRARCRPPALPAHHPLRRRWRGHGRRQRPAGRLPERGHALHRHPDAGAGAAAALADRGGRRRLRRRLREERVLRPGELLPQHGRQLGAEQGPRTVHLHHARRLPDRLARCGGHHAARRRRGHGRAPSPTSAARTSVEGAGHWVQQERPEETNAALLAFLADVG